MARRNLDNLLPDQLRNYIRELERELEKGNSINQELEEDLEKAVKKLTALMMPAHFYATYIKENNDKENNDTTCDVFDEAGYRRRVNILPELKGKEILKGQTVRLNQDGNCLIGIEGFETRGEEAILVEFLGRKEEIIGIKVRGMTGEEKVTELIPSLKEKVKIGDALLIEPRSGYAMAVLSRPLGGEVVTVSHFLEKDQVVVRTRFDDERVALIAPPLKKEDIKAGDKVLTNLAVGLIFEILPELEIKSIDIEEKPKVAWDMIGGLQEKIEIIRREIEWPFKYPELFAQMKLPLCKGFLMAGPPGTGKTMIAKAVANSFGGAFYYIAGPELLRGIVGATEALMRDIFANARRIAKEKPVIIFFDEMDSFLGTRGRGISSDVEKTHVPMFTSLVDGLEEINNIIIIGATNRADLIDPAVTRPGRMDRIIEIGRPDKKGAIDIFAKHLTPDLPFVKSTSAESLIQQTVEKIFKRTKDNTFVKISYTDGDYEVLHFSDFLSGSVIANIVKRAKKLTIRDHLENVQPLEIKESHLLEAVDEEFDDLKKKPDITNPDEWWKIAGIRGKEIKRGGIQPLFKTRKKKAKLD